jgi:hypothetical protein
MTVSNNAEMFLFYFWGLFHSLRRAVVEFNSDEFNNALNSSELNSTYETGLSVENSKTQ